ncbi:MAG: hypothetical protein MJ181_00330 [Treponema sp.]|nr:hypothetical protein [Treponema sp.]
MTETEGVKKIVKNSLDDCKRALFEMYGYDYSIVRHFEVKKDHFLGLWSKPKMCVMYQVKPRSTLAAPSYNEVSGDKDYLLRLATKQYAEEEDDRLQKNREAILNQNTSTLVTAQMQQMSQMQAALEQVQETLNRQAFSASSEKHETIARIEELLADNEFSYSYINMISDKIRKTFSLEQLSDFELIEKCVVDWIGETIEVDKGHHVRPPHITIIVGPTGVGKTTTLVKLVAAQVIAYKNSGRKYEARLITTDYSRVGALDQLKHFGEIFHIEVNKAENVDDLKKLLDSYRLHSDGIFIDTGGYSPNDSVHIGKLKDCVSVPGVTPDIYLAFDAKTKCSDLKNIMNNYEPFAYNSVIVTKCDESKLYGNIISSLYEKHKKIAYITDGQNAARNLEKADPVYFLERLKGFNLDMDHIREHFNNSEEN